MKPEKLLSRVSLTYQSNYECAMNCINSTKYSKKNSNFDCNIYYYDPHSRSCVLYEYDFSDAKTKNSKNLDANNEAFDYFIDECEMDELLGDVVGYSKYCRRILDFQESHQIKIIPYTDYRFSLSIRDSSLNWTPFVRKEFHYGMKLMFGLLTLL